MPPTGTVLHYFQSHVTAPKSRTPHLQISNPPPSHKNHHFPFFLSMNAIPEIAGFPSSLHPEQCGLCLPFAHQLGGPESSVGPVPGGLHPFPQQFEMRRGLKLTLPMTPAASLSIEKQGKALGLRDHGGSPLLRPFQPVIKEVFQWEQPEAGY